MAPMEPLAPAVVGDRDALVAALRARGVDYLAPADAQGPPVDDAALIASLAAHSDPRLRQALIALLLLHPGLAAHVPALRARLEPGPAGELTAHYMAAVYLRAMWGLQMERHLGAQPGLPDLFSVELGLPAPEVEWGKAGLHALADWHARTIPERANHLSEYEGVASLVLASLRARSRQHVAAPGG